MSNWFWLGARTGGLAGLVIAVLWVAYGILDDLATGQMNRITLTYSVSIGFSMIAAVFVRAIAGGCSSIGVHAAMSSMHPGLVRIISGILLGSVIGTIVEGVLGGAAVMVYGLVFTPTDGQIMVGVIMIALFGAIIGVLLGALTGYQASVG